MQRRPFIAACMILALPLCGQASPARDDPSATVTVTARRNDKAAIRNLVREMAPYLSDYGALARFHQPACFSIAGLPRAFAESMLARMTDDAQAGSVPVAEGHCRPNIRIYAVDSSQAEFENVRASLDPHGIAGSPALVRSDAVERSRDGDEKRTMRTSPGELSGFVALKIPTASRLSGGTRQDLEGVTVILRRDAAIGKTFHQLADYVVMRSLAQARDVRGHSSDTILSLFHAPNQAPDAMTDLDLNYLRSLYRGPANVPASMKIGQVVSDLANTQSRSGSERPRLRSPDERQQGDSH